MRADQAKTIAIQDYLAQSEGIRPASSRLNGTELWYHSPVREGDKTPSFKVNTTHNIWFDHGLNQGGKIIDLMCLMRGVTVSEALNILDRSGLYQGGHYQSTHTSKQDSALFKNAESKQTEANPKKSAVEKEKSQSSHSYVILDAEPLQHPALIQYLQNRCIDINIAQQYLEEVTFRHPEKLVQYYAVGWKNAQGYEVRNKYFKGFAGTGKSISTLNLDQFNECLVFEGFMDFLSYLTYLKQHKNTQQLSKGVIVLNSTALRKQLIPQISENGIKTLYCFLDNDASGTDTLDFLKEALTEQKMVDMSYLYEGHKDVNEWLCR